MPFSFEQFYLANRRILIWLVLAALLWLLRGYFDLIFVTCFVAMIVVPVAQQLRRRFGIPPRLALVLVYGVLLLALGGFVRFVTPNVVGEISRFVASLGAIQERLIAANDHFAERYPSLQGPMLGYLRNSLQPEVRDKLEADLQDEARRLGLPDEAAHSPTRWAAEGGNSTVNEALAHYEKEKLLGSLFEEAAGLVRKHAPQVVLLLYHGIATLSLSLLFSFLILVDLPRLRETMNGFQRSRLRDFYAEAAPTLARLGASVGLGIRAQASISAINAALTTTGLAILGVPSLAMLALIVFVCGLVPIVGMLASTVPIILIAVNAGGIKLIVAVVVMILIVHMIEAYLLNPLIYGAEFHFNPVLTLLILFIAHHAAGVWGMLLGLPVARYLITDVFEVPMEAGRRTIFTRLPTGSSSSAPDQKR
jgi:predicted PurR-regulated permease PerM